MARQMRSLDSGSVVTVHGWLLTRNQWEYYLLDNERDSDIRFALVDGHEQEMGDISLSELKPYITVVASQADLLDLAPAPNWEWVDNG